MNTTIKKLTLSITAAVIAGPVLFGMSATAGDYGGGLKGMRGSYVPVPAPVPIPDFRPKWYMRFDVGMGMGLDAKTSESGGSYGAGETTENLSAAAPFGFGGFTNTDDGSSYGHSMGIGAGYYYSRNFRVDVTGELRMEKESNTTGSTQYVDAVATVAAGGVTAAGATNDDTVNVTVSDTTSMQSAIFMANGYVDMNRIGRLTPYLGGGVGFAVNDVRRTHTTTLSSCESFTANNCDTPTAAAGYSSRTDRQYVYTLAANLTAGASYKISDVTSLDFNYRYLYVGGTDAMANINGNSSKVEIEDQHEHYIRAGLRWDIN
ncbi:MAG: opacity protein-like surface antigen [Alphaproteobacteria bacterium]|jgi:opacity protein-like surface antigen